MRQVTAAVSRDDSGVLQFETLTLGDPRPDEVVVEVAFAGICHTDIKAAHGEQGARKPAVFGHEGAGVVVEVGTSVTSLKPGDRVMMTHLSCGECRSCARGDTSYCLNSRALNMLAGRLDGSSGFECSEVHSHFFGQSSFATFALANVRNAIKVPDDIPLSSAATMGCGVMTGAGAVLNVLAVKPETSIVVTGTGAVGLAAIMAARIVGASRIIGVDLVDHRLELARQMGATDVFNAADSDVVAKIQKACAGGAQYAVEASGSPRALTTALGALGLHGACVIVGAAGDVDGTFRWRDLQRRAITIRGCVVGDARVREFIPQLFQYYREGRLPLEKMIAYYDFAQINAAMANAAAGGDIKPVLIMKPSERLQ
jgi:aryl-alcohol dehydrogenase